MMNQISQGASSFGISLFPAANSSHATKMRPVANSNLGNNLNIIA